jgi:M3 family oligoendopeptidase
MEEPPTPTKNLAMSDFRHYKLPRPEYDAVAAEYDRIRAAFGTAASAADALAAIESWDALRRRLSTWTSLVNIRFHQDTRNGTYKSDRDYCDELEPKLTNLAVDMKRRILNSSFRPAITEQFGRQTLDLWACDIASFDPAIENDLVAQAKLVADYTELLASAKLSFHGETLTLSEIVKYYENPDRGLRHEAAQTYWTWFGENRAALDDIFDRLVRLRHEMANKLGYENFIPLGYQRMQRTDYTQRDVDQFRHQVRESVVPLATKIRAQQAKKLGVDPLMAWDESIQDLAGNPLPLGDHDWMIDRASQMFAELDASMDAFFAEMRSAHLMDLRSREGKAGGGFCDVLPGFGMPFIYANFNGTMHDVGVFTHEMGHAYQVYSSLNQPMLEYIFPTMEACEIHSMGLEFLTWPQMELFFGGAAVRYRKTHLTQRLLLLPYIAAVDHFQHLVYESPDASPDDRAAMWQQMERTYLPWLNWGDLSHPAAGRRWQAQLHIFGSPFYYIDYALALTCALQLWELATRDRGAAMTRYLALCRRGGSAAFGELVQSAELTSPFAPKCLESAVARAWQELC